MASSLPQAMLPIRPIVRTVRRKHRSPLADLACPDGDGDGVKMQSHLSAFLVLEPRSKIFHGKFHRIK